MQRRHRREGFASRLRLSSSCGCFEALIGLGFPAFREEESMPALRLLSQTFFGVLRWTESKFVKEHSVRYPGPPFNTPAW